MQLGKHRLELGDVEAGALPRIDTEIPPAHLPAKGKALQIEEPRRAVDVGQAIGGQREQPLIFGPAREPEPQVIDEIGVMLLQHPKQRHDVARYVVDELDVGPAPTAQKNAAHADERFGVVAVGDGIDNRHDGAGQIALAADVRRQRSDGANCG